MIPYYETESGKIYNGECLDVLKQLPSESVNCAVTSPPYWALRDYGVKGSIWDGEPNCEHQWDLEEKKNPMDKGGKGQHDEGGRVGGMGVKRTTKLHSSGFCSKCGAWRGSLGLEPTFDLYIKHLCDIFDEVKRVLRKDGTCWVNLGDTYGGVGRGKSHNDGRLQGLHNQYKGGLPEKGTYGTIDKCLCQIPSRFSIEMCNRGWILRNTLIWHKPNCMPSSVKDRFTIDFEYLFFFVKNKKYWFETQREPQKRSSIKRAFAHDNLEKRKLKGNEPYALSGKAQKKAHEKVKLKFLQGEKIERIKRCVWKITTKPFKGAHFAVFPEELIETPIKAGCPENGVVLDMFMGSGTTGLVSHKLNRKWIGIELNKEYCEIAKKRIESEANQYEMKL